MFKVVVHGKVAYGEATGYVGVTKSARVNSPPEAVVKPPRQRIPLPTNTATCLNSQVQPDANGHFYFVPNLARAGSECNNIASKFEEETLQIQARQLCLLTDFYLEQICHNRNLTVTLGDPKSDPCTTTTTASLPQLARTALLKDPGLSNVKRIP